MRKVRRRRLVRQAQRAQHIGRLDLGRGTRGAGRDAQIRHPLQHRQRGLGGKGHVQIAGDAVRGAAVDRDARECGRAARPTAGRATRRSARCRRPFPRAASRQASPRPTISGAGSVPERRPRSCPPPENSGSTRARGPAADEQRADPLRAINLVPADRGEIDLPPGQIDRDLADRLRQVGVEQRPGLLGDRARAPEYPAPRRSRCSPP